MDNLWKNWDLVLRNLKDRIRNDRAFETWIKPIKPVKIENNYIYLEIPNPLFYKGISGFINDLRESLSNITGYNMEIKWSYPESKKNPPSLYFGEKLNPANSFDNFVRGQCNQLAHAAGIAIAQSPGIAYNPFFIYGGVGLGKTHLIQAIGSMAIKTNNCKTAYLPCENFVNLFIQSIQTKTMNTFRNNFRSLDILLIDDIHFIAGKEGTQEEFFNTFNSLYDQKKQIILTSDRPPKELFSLEKRLVSRFEWGLVTDLKPPEFETRVAILRKKCELKKIFLDDDVVFYIAENIHDNVRLLEGALNRLIAISSLLNKTLDINITKEYLRDLISSQKKIITIEKIQEKVAFYFNISVHDLKSSRRLKTLVVPRQIAMYIAREKTDMSLTAIAEEFGGKDHTTILYACKKLKTQLETDSYLKMSIEKIINSLHE
ncbi:MAG: chromosomal replication initiator protein DnaA [Candidatus Omnitrophica bacterium]|nr:chromosomal replication initiator protein DnaA [Candidatus Omnitrophota bacterium]